MWKIKVHSLVIKEDFKKINKKDQSFIIKTIYKKLSLSPDKFGSPLRYELKGFWKLKISEYRVIYKIEKQEVIVLVLKVGIRRDREVYRKMINRLNKIDRQCFNSS